MLLLQLLLLLLLLLFWRYFNLTDEHIHLHTVTQFGLWVFQPSFGSLRAVSSWKCRCYWVGSIWKQIMFTRRKRWRGKMLTKMLLTRFFTATLPCLLTRLVIRLLSINSCLPLFLAFSIVICWKLLLIFHTSVKQNFVADTNLIYKEQPSATSWDLRQLNRVKTIQGFVL